MRVAGQEKKNEIDTSLAADAADACMVARMRLVLSVSALLVVFVDPASLRGVGGSTWLLFCGYVLHSLVVYVYSELEAPLSQSRVIHWLDICWYALIVLLTDGVHSPFFLFFFFAILTSSFRWGFEEGARVTLASVALFAACGMGSATAQDLPRLLLRSTFILALGYMIIYWGRSKVELKRRLALLRAVSRLSNPRFGVDHTVTGILEKIQRFFLDSNTCLLVVRDKESGACSLRTIRQGDAHRSPQAARIAPELAALLMALAPHRAVIYRRSRWPRLPAFGGAATYDGEKGRWTKETHPACDGLAELLEAGAFISVPVNLRKSEGRLFVLSRCGAFRRADALFLGHVVAQAFPVVESIELLDRMASDAASQERLKIALDLHDTAIQPYIGLKMGLSALRNKASADNPLVEDLDKLQDMAAQVIGDLRRYAGRGAQRAGPVGASGADGAAATGSAGARLLRHRHRGLRRGRAQRERSHGGGDPADRPRGPQQHLQAHPRAVRRRQAGMRGRPAQGGDRERGRRHARDRIPAALDLRARQRPGRQRECPAQHRRRAHRCTSRYPCRR